MMQRVRAAFDWVVAVLLYLRVRAFAQREAVAIQEEAIASQAAGLKTALDAVRKAREQASDDPTEQALVEAFGAGVLGVTKLTQEMLSSGQGMTPEDRADALARPSVAFAASTGPWPGGPATKAIVDDPRTPADRPSSHAPEQQTPSDGSTPGQPVKKKRGRPSRLELEARRRDAQAQDGMSQVEAPSPNGR